MIEWKKINTTGEHSTPILASHSFFCRTNPRVGPNNQRWSEQERYTGSRSMGRWLRLVEGDSVAGSKGLHVTALELPLTSLADDVATTQRAIALEDGRSCSPTTLTEGSLRHLACLEKQAHVFCCRH
jgi:hypothetical protein